MWIAIVESDESGRVSKYQMFDNEVDANQHIVTHGGFVLPFDEVYDVKDYTFKDNQAVHAPIPPAYIDKDERLLRSEGSEIFTTLKALLFDMSDRLDVLEGNRVKTQGEKDAWMKSKMIGDK